MGGWEGGRVGRGDTVVKDVYMDFYNSHLYDLYTAIRLKLVEARISQVSQRVIVM